MQKRGFVLFITLGLMICATSLGAEEHAQVQEIELPEQVVGEVADVAETADENQLQLAEESWMAPSVLQNLDGPDKVQQAFGGCYTGCYSAQQSAGICPPGQIAEVRVSGPINACALGSLQCKSTCSGPVVSCNSFTPFC